MFYLFILETIGTSELLLIGLVALIIFGPRKLPELAKMLGKAMNEFRRTTDDFKETWAREVEFEKEEKRVSPELSATTVMGTSIEKTETAMTNEIVAPEIKQISEADFQGNLPEKTVAFAPKIESSVTEKRDWL